MAQVIGYTKTGNNAPFTNYVKNEVAKYFEENKISPRGNRSLRIKAWVLLTAYPIIWIVYLVLPPSIWSQFGTAIALAIDVGGIGYCVGHDGNHKSFSDKPSVNELMGKSFNLMGACSYFWRKFKHNVLHHFGVNVLGIDTDIDFGKAFRMSPDQKWYWWHIFQPLYMFVLYGLFEPYWILVTDFVTYHKIMRLRKAGNTSSDVKDFDRDEQILFWKTKALYIAFWFVIPIIIFSLRMDFKSALIYVGVWYLVKAVVLGWNLSFTFQLAHVVDGSSFPKPNNDGLLDMEPFEHQLITTGDFAQGNILVTEYSGGLNYQIEHHMFPTVSHVHYPAISKIVRRGADIYNMDYRSASLARQLWLHFKLIAKLGWNMKIA